MSWRATGRVERMAEDTTRGPQRTSQVLLLLFLAGICSRGYGYYNQTLKDAPQTWMDVVHGTAAAPEQYRVGVVMAAWWTTQHLHWGQSGLRLSQVFGMLDLLGSALAVLLLYSLLTRTVVFRRASGAMQWFGSAAFVALTLYLVDWTNWYQKVSTLPTAGLVAAILWLWTPRRESAPSASEQALLAAAFFALAGAQSFVRADVAMLVCAGIFVAALLHLGQLALPRGTALAVSALAALGVAAVQLYLMRVRYPQASYQGVPVVMLTHDWRRLTNWASALIFLAPLLWTLAQAVRRRYAGAGAGAAMLLAALGYAAVWLVLGRIEEVRIFLPMALAVTPVTVEMAMLSAAGAEAPDREAGRRW